MKRDNLRKIKVQLTDVKFELGYFHGWGESAYNWIGTVGLYEREDGTIDTTNPENVTFLD